MLTTRRNGQATLLTVAVIGLMLLGPMAMAAQADPPPPVQVTAGGPLLSGAENTVTLTLDAAGQPGISTAMQFMLPPR